MPTQHPLEGTLLWCSKFVHCWQPKYIIYIYAWLLKDPKSWIDPILFCSVKLQTPASRIKKGAEELEKETGYSSGEGHKSIYTYPPRQKGRMARLNQGLYIFDIREKGLNRFYSPTFWIKDTMAWAYKPHWNMPVTSWSRVKKWCTKGPTNGDNCWVK